jgi:PhzF family phenazine biosynthesis protein
MNIPIHILDSFTDRVFSGNPAAVCPLEAWLPDDLMQRIAMENNLSETAFLVKEGDDYRVRWFTPGVEVDLCGHATLASAAVLFEELGHPDDTVRFQSRSGLLQVSREAEGGYTLNLPADPPKKAESVPPGILEGLGVAEGEVWRGRDDYLVLLDTEDRVRNLRPDFRVLSGVPSRGVVATATGTNSDFASRCFYPQTGIDEDPVTGSAHCLLTSFWSLKTGKTAFKAVQLSARGGGMECTLAGDRVHLKGKVAFYLKGEISVPE